MDDGIDNTFSTLMLFKCTKREWAEQFCSGQLFLGTPQSWINMENEGRKGQGDKLEGTFYSVKESDNSPITDLMKMSKDLEFIIDGGLLFFRRKRVLDLRCHCLYGLHNTAFVKSIGEDGRAHYKTRIDKSYFSDFTSLKTREEFRKAETSDQPVVVFISNISLFFERVTKTLVSLGVDERDIIISPITYCNKYVVSTNLIQFPFELLYKDRSFKNQSEVRIIVNSKSSRFHEYLENHENKIDVGSLTDITEMYDYYYDDMSLERLGNKSMMFSLPESKNTNIYDMEFYELVGLLNSILKGHVEMINSPSDSENLQDRIKPLLDLISSKFGVLITVDDNKHMSMINVSDELFEQLKSNYGPAFERSSFESRIMSLVNKGNIEEALSECDLASSNPTLVGVVGYCKGELFRSLKKSKDAISSYEVALGNDYNRVQSLSGIASVYFDDSDYTKAIEVYQLVQEEKGYDECVWGNIGICYIHLGNYASAIEFFDRGIEKRPDDAYLHYNKGVACYRAGDMDSAKKCFERAVQLDSNNVEYANAMKIFKT